MEGTEDGQKMERERASRGHSPALGGGSVQVVLERRGGCTLRKAEGNVGNLGGIFQNQVP